MGKKKKKESVEVVSLDETKKQDSDQHIFQEVDGVWKPKWNFHEVVHRFEYVEKFYESSVDQSPPELEEIDESMLFETFSDADKIIEEKKRLFEIAPTLIEKSLPPSILELTRDNCEQYILTAKKEFEEHLMRYRVNETKRYIPPRKNEKRWTDVLRRVLSPQLTPKNKVVYCHPRLNTTGVWEEREEGISYRLVDEIVKTDWPLTPVEHPVEMTEDLDEDQLIDEMMGAVEIEQEIYSFDEEIVEEEDVEFDLAAVDKFYVNPGKVETVDLIPIPEEVLVAEEVFNVEEIMMDDFDVPPPPPATSLEKRIEKLDLREMENQMLFDEFEGEENEQTPLQTFDGARDWSGNEHHHRLISFLPPLPGESQLEVMWEEEPEEADIVPAPPRRYREIES